MSARTKIRLKVERPKRLLVNPNNSRKACLSTLKEGRYGQIMYESRKRKTLSDKFPTTRAQVFRIKKLRIMVVTTPRIPPPFMIAAQWENFISFMATYALGLIAPSNTRLRT